MGTARHSRETKDVVLKQIQNGVTYAAIHAKFGIPKSTLSFWVSNLGIERDRAKQLLHLSSARKAATIVLKKQREHRIAAALQAAKETVSVVPIAQKEITKTLLAMLYWAEGGKQEGNMKFTNTDPSLVMLFLSLLRASYEIDERRLHIALQVHSYHDKTKTAQFWSSKLKIPTSQFWKIYLKPRSGLKTYRRNFYGICNLHYASTPIQRELLAIGKELEGRMCN